eukprot:gene44650-55562_t
MSKPSQFSLLTQRRFAPFFWVQFLGAFNTQSATAFRGFGGPQGMFGIET